MWINRQEKVESEWGKRKREKDKVWEGGEKKSSRKRVGRKKELKRKGGEREGRKTVVEEEREGWENQGGDVEGGRGTEVQTEIERERNLKKLKEKVAKST